MNINQLEVFILIAKSRSFVRTAEQLFLSQPAVTQKIQSLENELGFTLLIRTKHKVELTPAGEEFLVGAQKMMDIYQKTLDVCSQILNETPDFIIHYVGKANLNILPRMLQDYYVHYPSCHVATQRVRLDQAANKVVDGTIRFLLTPANLFEGKKQIKFIPLYHARYFIVMSRFHPLAHFSELSWEQLKGNTILIPDQEFCPQHMLSMLKQLESKIPKFSRIRVKGTDDAFAQMLLSNHIAIMPEYTRPEHPELVSIPLLSEQTVTFGIAYRGALTSAEQKLVQHMRSTFEAREQAAL